MSSTFFQAGSKRRPSSPSVVVKNSSTWQFSTDEGYFPRHYDKTWRHPVPETSEQEAIESLKAASNAQTCDTHIWSNYRNAKIPLYVELDDYEIYSLPEDNFIGELHSLDHMDEAGKKLVFNGVLSIGSVRHYVQGVPVRSYSIEGYGVDDDPGTMVYIVSLEASRDQGYDIWYKLGSPSPQYRCFQEAFQWVATLGKHVVDFLEVRKHVVLADFRQGFNDWLQQRFPNNADLNKWHRAYGRTDFSKVVHTHIGYLWSEAKGLQNDRVLLEHPLWTECARDKSEMITPRCEKTIATPSVYRCFKNRYFAGQIREMQPSDAVRVARESRIQAFGMPSESHPISSHARISQFDDLRSTVLKVGDVVSISPDEYENRIWRKTAKDGGAVVREWFGYVQRVEPTVDSGQRLYVIWLYRPEDTTISTTDYPVEKELFLSDNCNCTEHRLLSTDVVRRCTVEWFSRNFDTGLDFLVRQKYVTKTSSFVSMTQADFSCTCRNSQSKTSLMEIYCKGDTVYLNEAEVLQPVMIEENNIHERQIKVRRLLRLCNFRSGTTRGLPQRRIAANELVWTEHTCHVSYKRISGRCHVRFFNSRDILTCGLPFPYSRGGAGHYWVLSMSLNAVEGQQMLEDLADSPKVLRQESDYGSKDSSPKLPGLSLFSGCGNLDKGLEEGGAVKFHTSVDMNGRAIQTLHANAENPDEHKLWYGSVDDYLHALLAGTSPSPENMKLVAKIGQVAVIAAGSPCPGFSKLQQDWMSEQSLRNASHVTTFASFVDVYRPEYGFLENVVNMGSTRKGFEEELVLSQLVGCLVSMGYQIQQFIMSSWHYGSPQHRNRLILAITAPGRSPIIPPRPSHKDPEGFKSKSVGKLLNGERFGVQDVQLTPFPHFTPEKALGHLTDIGCGIKHPCIRYPDHVLRLRPNIKERRVMTYIPRYPRGVGLAYAAKHGIIPKYLYETKSEINGKSYKRIKPDGLIGTIITAPAANDSRSGPFFHWDQNRTITLEEARIAQGIPDNEVLIGNVKDQFKMVGNAVDRRVAEQLGLALRRALDESPRGILMTKRQSVSVMITSRKQSSSLSPQIAIQQEPNKASATYIPQTHQLVTKADDTSAIAQGVDHLTLAGCQGSAYHGEAHSVTESNKSLASFKRSSHSVIVEEVESEDEQGPIHRGRRTVLKTHITNDTTISRTLTQKSELRAGLRTGLGPNVHFEPPTNSLSENVVTHFDHPETMPTLAISPNGFPAQLLRTISSLNSSSSSATSSKRLAPKKLSRRKRPQTLDDVDSEGHPSRGYDGATDVRKRMKRSASSEEESPPVYIKSEPGTQNGMLRRTRHSGMGIEFIPTVWNKPLEKVIRAETKASSKRYA